MPMIDGAAVARLAAAGVGAAVTTSVGGDVTGFFRPLEVTGVVRNLPDGRVELVAEGLKDELEAFQEGIRESGLGGFISNEERTWEDPKGEFRGFGISS